MNTLTSHLNIFTVDHRDSATRFVYIFTADHVDTATKDADIFNQVDIDSDNVRPTKRKGGAQETQVQETESARTPTAARIY